MLICGALVALAAIATAVATGAHAAAAPHQIDQQVQPSGCSAAGFAQFATITTYAHASACLREMRDANQLPAGLFDPSPLAEKDAQLRAAQCEARALVMVGRHAARYPDEGEIKQFRGDLNELARILAAHAPEGGATSELPLISAAARKKIGPKFNVASNNLLTEVGIAEQKSLAVELKRLYPEFFDGSRAHIQLATTSKLRTAQTATEFARLFDNFDLGPECAKDLQQGEAPTPMACYKHVLKTRSRIELEYHKVCKKQLVEQRAGELTRTIGPQQLAHESAREGGYSSYAERSRILKKIANLKSRLLAGLAQKVNNKLLRSRAEERNELSVSSRHLESAYNVCRYEIAASLRRPSIWCNLFDERDLRALDYLEDANIFHKINSRLESNKLQACPIVNEIVGLLSGAAFSSSSSSSLSSPVDERQAYFGFTHVGVLKKILAVFGLFETNRGAGYTEADLEAIERAQFDVASVSERNRQWRTSLMVPFSANVNFVLYRCAGEGIHHSKILTTISGQPVRVRGCSDSACPADEFLAAYGHMLQCDPKRVCEEVAKGLRAGQAGDDE